MDDLISRKAAIDAIEEYADRLQIVDWKENPGVPYKAYALNWCINTIRDLPSSQPDLEEAYICGETEAEARYHAERKKGRRIPQDHNKTNGMMSTLVYYYPKCSVCGHCANYTNFCPNCGARMNGGDEGGET